MGVAPLRRDDHWSSGTFRHVHIRLFLQTATFRTANGRPYVIGRSDGRSHMTIFPGPTGPKILLTGNQVIMPYRVPQNDSLHDRSANADRSHMNVFSGPTGPKISLTGNHVIMTYPVHFPIVGAGARDGPS